MRLLLMTFIIMIFSNIHAQNTIVITGTVLDKRGNPVADVEVSYLCDSTDLITPVFTDENGEFEFATVAMDINETTPIPDAISLGANYPNPFNPGTLIPLTTNETGVFLIFDLKGRQINSLRISQPGSYTISWGGRDKFNLPVAAGIYFYMFQTEHKRLTGKMLLMDGGGVSGLSIAGSSGVPGNKLAKRTNEDCDTYSLSFSANHISDLIVDLGPTGFENDVTITQVVNRGPYWTTTLPDTILLAGDTLLLNLNKYVYDDGQPTYRIADTVHFEIVRDSLLQYVVRPETASVAITVEDDLDSSLSIADLFSITGDNNHLFFITDGDPKGIYVLNPYTMTYVDSLIFSDSSFRYGMIEVNNTGKVWYAKKGGGRLVWIDVKTKEVFQSITTNNISWLEKSYDGSKLIVLNGAPARTFSVYDSETGNYIAGGDTTLRVGMVRASKVSDVIFVWGSIRSSGTNRIGAWDISTRDWLWLVPYDSTDIMERYDSHPDMAVSYDGNHVFFHGSDSWGNGYFYHLNAQTGEVISRQFINGFNGLYPAPNNQYVYLTFNIVPWANWLEGPWGIARYDILNHTMKIIIASLRDLDYNCAGMGYLGTAYMSILGDSKTGIVYGGGYCPDDPKWNSLTSIMKIDLENIKFLDGISMPHSTKPGYVTQRMMGRFVKGKYPY